MLASLRDDAGRVSLFAKSKPALAASNPHLRRAQLRALARAVEPAGDPCDQAAALLARLVIGHERIGVAPGACGFGDTRNASVMAGAPEV